MHLIEIYILRRTSIFFVSILSTAIILTWTVQLLEKIDFLTTSGQNFLKIIQFSSLFIPSAMQIVIPFSLVIAVTQVLTKMNNDSELIIINSTGTPPLIIWRPILALGLILSILSFIIANFIVPYARTNMRKMMTTSQNNIINLFLQVGHFHELGKKVYLEIGEKHHDGSIGRLFIVDQRNPKLDLFYYAVQGMIKSELNKNFLILQNGEVQRREKKTGNVSIIQFEAYSFDLSQFIPKKKSVIIYPKDLFLKDLYHLPKNYKQHPIEYNSELHKRLTEWVYPFVFTLIGIATAGEAKSYRNRDLSASLLAIIFTVFIYWLSYICTYLADKKPMYIPLLYITPVSISTLLILMLYTNRYIRLIALNQIILYFFNNKYLSKG
ncbi:MAG: lipopolysaccharide export system permease protein [Candidatus Tokpelaia sp. JSC161]|jgi:lipopolysaccharide export system permease protein|nr:MAG: lipopolysaccharide export system permease protein [Candidatus Tokpelaia sp. JSC161]